jgi:hypothetical protein
MVGDSNTKHEVFKIHDNRHDCKSPVLTVMRIVCAYAHSPYILDASNSFR